LALLCSRLKHTLRGIHFLPGRPLLHHQQSLGSLCPCKHHCGQYTCVYMCLCLFVCVYVSVCVCARAHSGKDLFVFARVCLQLSTHRLSRKHPQRTGKRTAGTQARAAVHKDTHTHTYQGMGFFSRTSDHSPKGRPLFAGGGGVAAACCCCCCCCCSSLPGIC